VFSRLTIESFRVDAYSRKPIKVRQTDTAYSTEARCANCDCPLDKEQKALLLRNVSKFMMRESEREE